MAGCSSPPLSAAKVSDCGARPKQRWSGASWEIMGLGLWHHFRRRAGDAFHSLFDTHTYAFRAPPANGPTATCGTCLLSFYPAAILAPALSRFLRHKGIRSLIPTVASLVRNWVIKVRSADGQTKSQRLTLYYTLEAVVQTGNFMRNKGSCVLAMEKKYRAPWFWNIERTLICSTFPLSINLNVGLATNCQMTVNFN